MNVKLLFIFLIVLGISEVSFGGVLQRKNHDRRGIILSSPKHTERKYRSVFILPFRAFFTSSLLSVEQDSSVNSLSYVLTVKDASTDDTILIQSAVGNTEISIDGLPSGEYKLEVEMDGLLLCGNFVIDDYSFGIEE